MIRFASGVSSLKLPTIRDVPLTNEVVPAVSDCVVVVAVASVCPVT